MILWMCSAYIASVVSSALWVPPWLLIRLWAAPEFGIMWPMRAAEYSTATQLISQSWGVGISLVWSATVAFLGFQDRRHDYRRQS